MPLHPPSGGGRSRRWLPAPRRPARDVVLLLAGAVAGTAMALSVAAAWRPAVLQGEAPGTVQAAGAVRTGLHAGRRVVTGHDAMGRSIVVSDGMVSPSKRFGDIDFADLWRTTTAPAAIEAGLDADSLTAAAGLAEPGGTVLRLVDYQPPSAGGRRTPMHRTETIDYAIVVQGEIVLVLDSSELRLEAGDVVVQRGTSHAWENRSDRVARVAFVLLDGRFSKELATNLHGASITP